MKTRQLGATGPRVSALGLGCMSLGIADVYTSSARDDAAAVGLIQRAIELGVTLLDTANIYGTSELQVGKAIKGRRDHVVVATKFGFVSAVGNADRTLDARPASVLRACDESLRRLDVDYIDVYYLHRVDPHVDIEDTVGAMAQLVAQGKVRTLGLSEASPATVRRAQAVHPIAAVQTEYSLFSREPEDELLPTLSELGIALVAYSPLGRGFLAGRFRTPADLSDQDWRHGNPRFQGANFATNRAIVDEFERVAQQKGCTPAQLALAWLLARHDNVIPIPGTSSVARLEENINAVNVRLSEDDLSEIEHVAVKGMAAGERYAANMMQLING